MSYFLQPMGDGPVTSPSQVDTATPGGAGSMISDGNSIVIAEVPPSRVDCSALPADSPWRKPGQVCATDFSIGDMVTGLLDKVRGVLSPSAATATAVPATSDGPPVVMIAVGVAVAAYFMFKKKKRN